LGKGGQGKRRNKPTLAARIDLMEPDEDFMRSPDMGFLTYDSPGKVLE
jgi:hypothetical protein